MTETVVTKIRFLHGDMAVTTLSTHPNGEQFILLEGISVPTRALENVGLEWEEVLEPEIVKFEDINVKVIGRRIREGKIRSLDVYAEEISITTEEYNYRYLHPGDSLEIT